MKNKTTVFLIGRILLFCISCAAVLAFTSGVTGQHSTYSNILSIGLALIGALLLTAVFARWERLNLTDVGIIPGNKTVRRVLTGLCIGSTLAVLQPVLVFSLGHMSMTRSPTVGSAAIAANFLLFLLIACREEIAFRGYPMRALNNSMGPIAAQVIIAIIFIIEHKIGGMTWLEAIIGPGMGAVLFGLAALRTKGLALSTGLHTSWNFVQWFLGFKGEHGFYRVTIEKGFDASVARAGWVSYIFVMALGICIIYLCFKEKQKA